MDKHAANNWVNEVMNSLEGIQPLPGDPLLYNKVNQKLAGYNYPKQIKQSWLPGIAAAAAILILINTLSIIHFKKQSGSFSNTDTYGLVSAALDHSSGVNL
jgi:hypothetical protein